MIMKNTFMACIAMMIVITVFLGSCVHSSGTEKHQNTRNNSINVKEKVKEFETGNILVGSISRLYTIGEYLLIADHKSFDRLIHIFNKGDFSYVTSVGSFGEGPGEITNMGHIGIDELHRIFYVSDHSKQKIFSYNLDSVLVDSLYKPQIKTVMNQNLFPGDYQYINDTLSIAIIIKLTSNSTFDQSLGKWNMKTGELIPMKYTHPDVRKKRITFGLSEKNGIYVECYTRHDLMTICSLDGDLRYNIYGPDWNGGEKSRIHTFGNVMIGDDKIFALYSGGDYDKEYYPTKILVFDLEGNYLKTLETHYKIADCCYDQSNNRIIMSLNEEIQLGYLSLDNLLE